MNKTGKTQNDALSPGYASKGFLIPVALASLILLITMGIRQTVGLFVHPIVETTAMGIAEVSLAFATGQLVWGAFQPLFGAWADKKGPFPVLLTGAILLACGQLLTIWATSFLPLALTQGLLSPAGAAAGSFSLLIGIVAARLPPDKSSVASGLISAGNSMGQFSFALIVQALINLRGYTTGLIFLAASSLASIIPAWFLCGEKNAIQAARPAIHNKENTVGLKQQLRIAARTPSYLLLHAGFFTCSFHVAFLVTHLPGEISLCGHAASVSAMSISLIGLCNIAGSIFAGILGKHFRMKYILAALYAFRALMIAVYLFSPKTETTFYIFAVTTGLTWLATVPPTAGIVGKLFGTRYLATLFGFTLLTHQIGGFLGAWFGGLAMQQSGNLLWVWYLDVALALFAAVVNLPIREEKTRTQAI
ncbi:MAG: MFS transporter [Candidatus Accumulibacter sp.]|jgi:predicted MFS family arabinose efflux permease|nr:MFS transporter [Accumulibacter sp.]